MIILAPEHRKQLAACAEAAYPHECCGLITAGSDSRQGWHCVTGIIPSPNVSTGDRRHSFEIDPQVRFDLMRDVTGTDSRIFGHYHSHPDQGAVPSETDLAMAFESELIWLILSVRHGCLVDTRAYGVSPDATSFYPMAISGETSEKTSGEAP